MGVYIKGMEMPESCSDCAVRYEMFCPLRHRFIADEGRRKDCPLIELPPHGRLIDILDVPNALRNYFDIGDSYVYNLTRVKEAFAVGTVHLDDFVEWDENDIDELTAYISANAPTIIEAEEAERAEWYRELSIAHTREIQTALSSAPTRLDGE